MEKEFSRGLKNMEFIDTGADDQIVKNIPTPEIVPEPPNLSSVPKEVLQSGVIETLISQNDDLMARLSVQIRRSHSYEAELESVKANLEKTDRLYQSHRDQISIWREKEKKWIQKYKATEEFAKKVEGEFSWVEYRYAELAKAKNTAEEQFNETIKQLSDKARKYQRHIARIRKYVRPKINLLKQQIQTHDQYLIEQQSVINKIQDEKALLKQQIESLNSEIGQNTVAAKAELMRLTDSHEREVIDLKNEIEHHENLCKKLKKKMKDFDNVVEKAAVLENKVIHLKRKRQLVEEQIFIESEKAKSSQVKLKKQITDLEQENEEYATRQQRLERQNKLLNQSNTDLGQRLDALQLSWDEQNKKLAANQELIERLQKINSEFAEKINLQQSDQLESEPQG